MPRRKAISAYIPTPRNLPYSCYHFSSSFFYPLLLFLFLLFCVCSEDCTYVCMWFWRTEDINYILKNLTYLFRDILSLACNLLIRVFELISVSTALRIQASSTTSNIFMWVQGIELSSPCFLCSYFSVCHIFCFKPYSFNIFELTILFPLIYVPYFPARILPRL